LKPGAFKLRVNWIRLAQPHREHDANSGGSSLSLFFMMESRSKRDKFPISEGSAVISFPSTESASV
jgi:hypothetical protein